MSVAMRPPFETFKRPTCKGSFVLASACGNCERCDWERDNTPGMVSPLPPRRDRDIPTDERVADKEAIKAILRKYSGKFAGLLVSAAMNDLDLER